MASQFPNDPNDGTPPPPPPMTPPPPPPSIASPATRAGMIGRIQRLLVNPAAEFRAIDTEPMEAKSLFLSWAVPLAAIGPICGFIGMQLFGVTLFGVTYRPPLVTSLVNAIIGYAISLAATWAFAMIVDALAPSFGSTRNFNQAMKAVCFSYTAAWLAAVLQIIPALSIIGGLLGLYSLYLLWVGLPMMMKTPGDKAVGYVIVSIVVAVVLFLLIGVIVGAVAAAFYGVGHPGAGTLTIG